MHCLSQLFNLVPSHEVFNEELYSLLYVSMDLIKENMKD